MAENTKYILILEEPKPESTQLRFIEVDTATKVAHDVTHIFVQGAKVLKKLSHGTMWARGTHIYGAKYNNWVFGTKTLFGPATSESSETIRKLCKEDHITAENLIRLLAYEPIFMG